MEKANRVQAPADWAVAAQLGHLLADLARDFDLRTRQKCQAHGHPKVRCVHTSLIGHIGRETLRLSELASRAGVSQQAVGKLVRQLELFGYLESRVPAEDRRSRQIALTKRGEALLEEFEEIAEAVRADYTELLGADTVGLLEATLQQAARQICTQSVS